MLVEKFLFDKLSHDSVQNFRHDLAAVFGSLPKFIFSLLLRPLSVQTVSTYKIGLIQFETKIMNSKVFGKIYPQNLNQIMGKQVYTSLSN